MGYFMGLLTNKKLIALSGVSLAIIILIVTAYIMAVSDEGYCITPSPVISASPTAALYGQPITITGQNFTPNKKAFLYQIDEHYNGNNSWSEESGYTTDVDINGNISYVLIESEPSPGMLPNSTTIYAQDVSVAGRKSNTISLTLISNPCITPYPILNGPTALPTTESTATTMPTSIIPIVSDMPTPPSPAIPMGMAFIILIATGAVLLIIGRSKKK